MWTVVCLTESPCARLHSVPSCLSLSLSSQLTQYLGLCVVEAFDVVNKAAPYVFFVGFGHGHELPIADDALRRGPVSSRQI